MIRPDLTRFPGSQGPALGRPWVDFPSAATTVRTSRPRRDARVELVAREQRSRDLPELHLPEPEGKARGEGYLGEDDIIAIDALIADLERRAGYGNVTSLGQAGKDTRHRGPTGIVENREGLAGQRNDTIK